MLRHRFLATLLLASLTAVPSGIVLAQTTAKAPTPALELDPGTSGDAPDPLTPAEEKGPPPAAPGAPASLASAAPGEALDPIIEAARKLVAAPSSRLADHKEDAAAVVDYYGSVAKPVFVDAGGFTARGRLVAEEISKADDWGLKASAFDLPKPVASDASPEDKARAEIKLAAPRSPMRAMPAAAGSSRPRSAACSTRSPPIYDPKSLIRAVAASETADAYLRDLHPKHAGFHNLRKALLPLARLVARNRHRPRSRSLRALDQARTGACPCCPRAHASRRRGRKRGPRGCI